MIVSEMIVGECPSSSPEASQAEASKCDPCAQSTRSKGPPKDPNFLEVCWLTILTEEEKSHLKALGFGTAKSPGFAASDALAPTWSLSETQLIGVLLHNANRLCPSASPADVSDPVSKKSSEAQFDEAQSFKGERRMTLEDLLQCFCSKSSIAQLRNPGGVEWEKFCLAFCASILTCRIRIDRANERGRGGKQEGRSQKKGVILERGSQASLSSTDNEPDGGGNEYTTNLPMGPGQSCATLCILASLALDTLAFIVQKHRLLAQSQSVTSEAARDKVLGPKHTFAPSNGTEGRPFAEAETGGLLLLPLTLSGCGFWKSEEFMKQLRETFCDLTQIYGCQARGSRQHRVGAKGMGGENETVALVAAFCLRQDSTHAPSAATSAVTVSTELQLRKWIQLFDLCNGGTKNTLSKECVAPHPRVKAFVASAPPRSPLAVAASEVKLIKDLLRGLGDACSLRSACLHQWTTDQLLASSILQPRLVRDPEILPLYLASLTASLLNLRRLPTPNQTQTQCQSRGQICLLRGHAKSGLQLTELLLTHQSEMWPRIPKCGVHLQQIFAHVVLAFSIASGDRGASHDTDTDADPDSNRGDFTRADADTNRADTDFDDLFENLATLTKIMGRLRAISSAGSKPKLASTRRMCVSRRLALYLFHLTRRTMASNNDRHPANDKVAESFKDELAAWVALDLISSRSHSKSKSASSDPSILRPGPGRSKVGASQAPSGGASRKDAGHRESWNCPSVATGMKSSAASCTKSSEGKGARKRSKIAAFLSFLAALFCVSAFSMVAISLFQPLWIARVSTSFQYKIINASDESSNPFDLQAPFSLRASLDRVRNLTPITSLYPNLMRAAFRHQPVFGTSSTTSKGSSLVRNEQLKMLEGRGLQREGNEGSAAQEVDGAVRRSQSIEEEGETEIYSQTEFKTAGRTARPLRKMQVVPKVDDGNLLVLEAGREQQAVQMHTL